MSSYQRIYWYSKVAEKQGGEFCKGCGISVNSNWKNKKIKMLVIDKINNNGNHSITDNTVSDFQLLCTGCNRIKNPSKKPEDLEQTQSEKTNRRAEKPLMEWVMAMLRSGKTVTWKYIVSEGSYKFDISPETIQRRYYKKYFAPECESSPFAMHTDLLGETTVYLKNMDNPKVNLDIDPITPTPLINDELGWIGNE